MGFWPESARYRLAWEEKLLQKEMSHFSFFDRAREGLTTVRGYHITHATKQYQLVVWLKTGFPNRMPGLYVTSPVDILDYWGRPMRIYGNSHAMHTWTPDWENYVQICHCKPEFWRADNTILSVILKGMLWLDAYEFHLKTGNDINTYSLSY